MKEYISIIHRLSMELEKRNLHEKTCEFHPHFPRINRYIWNVDKNQKFPIKFSCKFYEELLDQLSVREEYIGDSPTVGYKGPASEIEEYLQSTEFIKNIDEYRYGFLKKFRNIGKLHIILELNQRITKILKFKQSRKLSLIKLLDKMGEFGSYSESQLEYELLKTERERIKSFYSNEFNTYEDYHEYFKDLYDNYFLYDKELIDCYIEVWSELNSEKESLENIILYCKCLNFMLNENLTKEIDKGYRYTLRI